MTYSSQKQTSDSLLQLLDQSHRLSLQATLKSPSGTGVNHVEQLIVSQVNKLLDIKTSEGELLELSLLSQSGNSLSI